MRLRDARELWRLSVRRMDSERAYLEFQALQARLLLRYLEDHGVHVSGRRVLDLGSGLGGYSGELAARGARVVALDLTSPRVRGVAVHPIGASAADIPLRDGAVDVVLCASLIEHVPEPARVLREIERVLRPGGVAYVSFPPYYSPPGGHQFSPFHYLGERIALRLCRRRRLPGWVEDIYPVNGEAASFAHLFAGWGLYRMTLRKFRRLLRERRLRGLDVSTRYLPVSFIRWPLIGEVLTWHAQFLLRKTV